MSSLNNPLNIWFVYAIHVICVHFINLLNFNLTYLILQYQHQCYFVLKSCAFKLFWIVKFKIK